MKTAYLIGYPFLKNIGDHVLWEGCWKYLNERFHLITDEEMLKKYGPYNKVPDAAIDEFLSNLASDDLIFFKGGGYFNDYSEIFLMYVCSIIKRIKKQKAFFLPQSINFSKDSSLYKRLYSVFLDKEVHIIVRENISHEISRKLFPSCGLFLNTDMAFYLYPIETDISLGGNSHGILFNLRNDGEEKRSLFDYLILNNILIPMIKTRTRVVVEDLMDYGSPHNHKFSLDIAIHRTSAFNIIVTDRLHGHILALLMNKPSVLIRNNYHKNKSIYETWLADVSISQIANSFLGLAQNIMALKNADTLSAYKKLKSLGSFESLDEYIFLKA